MYKKKHIIILFTSRYMGRNNDNSKKAHDMGFKFTKKQLKDWELNIIN